MYVNRNRYHKEPNFGFTPLRRSRENGDVPE